jgi:hypothetical protein
MGRDTQHLSLALVLVTQNRERRWPCGAFNPHVRYDKAPDRSIKSTMGSVAHDSVGYGSGLILSEAIINQG